MNGSPEQKQLQSNGVLSLGINFENFVEQSISSESLGDPDDDFTRYLSQYGLS